jgi:hypothetical protein
MPACLNALSQRRAPSNGGAAASDLQCAQSSDLQQAVRRRPLRNWCAKP